VACFLHRILEGVTETSTNFSSTVLRLISFLKVTSL